MDGEPELALMESTEVSYAYIGDGVFFSSGYHYTEERLGWGTGTYHLTEDGTALVCDQFNFYYFDDEMVVYTNATATELVAAIAPDAHIILEPGVYNFSPLTEETPEPRSEYAAVLEGGGFLSSVSGLTLEAAEGGTVELVTENGDIPVLSLEDCENVTLRGFTCGHIVERGTCAGSVLNAGDCKNLTVEGCRLYGCGTTGISAQGVEGLTVTGTEIYECSDSIFALEETGGAVFSDCVFRDNRGYYMFYIYESEALVENTEIYGNRGGLMPDYAQGDTDRQRITFRNCAFRDNPEWRDVDPGHWPCAAFESCDLPAVSGGGTAGNAYGAYDALIARFAALAADPYGFSNADGPGERSFLAVARDMPVYYECDALDGMGYIIADLSGDGVPELAVGSLSEHGGETDPYGGQVYALYTLANGQPRLVFEGWYRSSYSYLGQGRFSYYGSGGAAETGLGTVALSRDGTELKVENFYFTCPDEADPGTELFYQNETGDWEPEKSQQMNISWDEFWDLEEPSVDLPLTLFAGITGGGNPGPSTSSDGPVSVRYLDPERDQTPYWVTLYDGPEAAFILFTTDSAVWEFTLWTLSAEDDTETGALLFSSAQAALEEGLDSCPEVMTPDTPVAAQLVFWGDLPGYGISYVDGNGAFRRFVLIESGYDGSLLLEEADPNKGDFVLG